MAKIRRAKLHPTYLYINNYFNSEQFPEWLPIKGATHANEYPYINGLFPVGEFTFNEQDKQHSQTLIQIISNFVKHGEPKIKEWSSNSTGNDPDLIPPLKIMEMGIVDGEHKLFRKEYKLYGEKESLRDFEDSAYFWTKFCYDFRFDPVKGKEKDKFTRLYYYNYY